MLLCREVLADVVRWEGCLLGLPRLLADVVAVVAHPLLAAAARQRGQPGAGTAPVGQRHLVRAQGHAAHHAVHAAALVLTAGLEVLAVLVDAPAELTWSTLGLG